MSIEDTLLHTFKQYCKENGMKVSTKVEQMMRDLMQNSSLGHFKRTKK